MTSLRSRLMVDGVRPLVRAAPALAWVTIARVASCMGSPLQILRKRDFYGSVLRACARDDSLWACLTLATRMAYLRLRALDFYFHEGSRHLQLEWEGESPHARPCCYVALDAHGMEHVASLLPRFDGWIVRQRFDGEGEVAAEDRSWRAHCARLRERTCTGRMIEAGSGAAGWRSLVASPRTLVVFQGNILPEGGKAIRVLDRDVNMPLGAVRLARLCSLPLRFMRVVPRGSGWVIRLEAPMVATEQALHERIERELRERPEAWILWPLLLRTPA